jgi:S-adenosylmethionine/arginine decarboxylase-like enzyme
MAWGYHLMLDCMGGHKIDDKEHIHAFIKELVPAIDMIAFGEPWIERFATHDPTKAGISFCQMIETSNICGHFVESNGDFYIDVFSCKPFDPVIVEDIVAKYFNPASYSIAMTERDARQFVEMQEPMYEE